MARDCHDSQSSKHTTKRWVATLHLRLLLHQKPMQKHYKQVMVLLDQNTSHSQFRVRPIFFYCDSSPVLWALIWGKLLRIGLKGMQWGIFRHTPILTHSIFSSSILFFFFFSAICRSGCIILVGLVVTLTLSSHYMPFSRGCRCWVCLWVPFFETWDIGEVTAQTYRNSGQQEQPQQEHWVQLVLVDFFYFH